MNKNKENHSLTVVFLWDSFNKAFLLPASAADQVMTDLGAIIRLGKFNPIIQCLLVDIVAKDLTPVEFDKLLELSGKENQSLS